MQAYHIISQQQRHFTVSLGLRSAAPALDETLHAPRNRFPRCGLLGWHPHPAACDLCSLAGLLALLEELLELLVEAGGEHLCSCVSPVAIEGGLEVSDLLVGVGEVVPALEQPFEVLLVGGGEEVVEVVARLREDLVHGAAQLGPQLAQLAVEDALQRDRQLRDGPLQLPQLRRNPPCQLLDAHLHLHARGLERPPRLPARLTLSPQAVLALCPQAVLALCPQAVLTGELEDVAIDGDGLEVGFAAVVLGAFGGREELARPGVGGVGRGRRIGGEAGVGGGRGTTVEELLALQEADDVRVITEHITTIIYCPPGSIMAMTTRWLNEMNKYDSLALDVERFGEEAEGHMLRLSAFAIGLQEALVLLHRELPLPAHLVLQEWHGNVVLEVALHHLFLLGRAHAHLRPRPPAEVVERGGRDPHQVAVHLQRTAVLVVDEDADRQALYLLCLKHPREPRLQVRPDEVRLRVVDLDALHRPPLPPLPLLAHTHCHSEEPLHALLVDGEVLCEGQLVLREETEEGAVEVVAVGEDGELARCLEGLARGEEAQLDPAAAAGLHDLGLSGAVEQPVELLGICAEGRGVQAEEVGGEGEVHVEVELHVELGLAGGGAEEGVQLGELEAVAEGEVAQPAPDETLRAGHSQLAHHCPCTRPLGPHAPPPLLQGVGCDGSPYVVVAAEEEPLPRLRGAVLEDHLGLEVGGLVLQDDCGVAGVEELDEPQHRLEHLPALELVLHQHVVPAVEAFHLLAGPPRALAVELGGRPLHALNLDPLVPLPVVEGAALVHPALAHHQPHAVAHHLQQRRLPRPARPPSVDVEAPPGAHHQLVEVVEDVEGLAVEEELLGVEEELLEEVGLRVEEEEAQGVELEASLQLLPGGDVGAVGGEPAAEDHARGHAFAHRAEEALEGLVDAPAAVALDPLQLAQQQRLARRALQQPPQLGLLPREAHPVGGGLVHQLAVEEGLVGGGVPQAQEAGGVAEAQQVAAQRIREVGPLVHLPHHEQLRLQQVQVVLLVLQRLRDLHDRPLQRSQRPWRPAREPFRARHHVVVDGHELLVGLDECGAVAGERIVEEAEVLEVGAGDGGGGELVVVEIEDLEVREGGEAQRQFCQLVRGEVQLDQRDALVHRRQLVGPDVRPCQDQQLQARRVLDELADLQLLVESVPHAVITLFIYQRRTLTATQLYSD